MKKLVIAGKRIKENKVILTYKSKFEVGYKEMKIIKNLSTGLQDLYEVFYLQELDNKLNCLVSKELSDIKLAEVLKNTFSMVIE